MQDCARLSCLKATVGEGTTLGGDYRSHFMLTTEEGDVIFADLHPFWNVHRLAKIVHFSFRPCPQLI